MNDMRCASTRFSSSAPLLSSRQATGQCHKQPQGRMQGVHLPAHLLPCSLLGRLPFCHLGGQALQAGQGLASLAPLLLLLHIITTLALRGARVWVRPACAELRPTGSTMRPCYYPKATSSSVGSPLYRTTACPTHQERALALPTGPSGGRPRLLLLLLLPTLRLLAVCLA